MKFCYFILFLGVIQNNQIPFLRDRSLGWWLRVYAMELHCLDKNPYYHLLCDLGNVSSALKERF